MEFGASIFFTEYSISPTELAVALEERGFASLWVFERNARRVYPRLEQLIKV